MEVPRLQYFGKVVDVPVEVIPVFMQRQVRGAADDVYGGGYGVWAVMKGLFLAFYAIFRTPLHGVESQLSVVVVPIDAQWVWTDTYT